MAPVSPSSRMRKMREKKKLNKEIWENYKANEALRSRAIHIKRRGVLQSLSKIERNLKVELIRKKAREIKQEQRKKKAVNTNTNEQEGTAFKTRQAKGKAMARIKRRLPKNPEQRREILIELTVDYNQPSCSLPNERHSTAPPHIIELVENFYSSDEISRASPSVKDMKTTRNSGETVQIPARHMLYTLKEAYYIFKNEYPDISPTLGKSKFAALRPNHVLTANKMPHNVCICTIHENFRMALKGLQKTDKVILANLSNLNLLDQLVCANSNIECFINKCGTCQDGKGLKKVMDVEFSNILDDTVK